MGEDVIELCDDDLAEVVVFEFALLLRFRIVVVYYSLRVGADRVAICVGVDLSVCACVFGICVLRGYCTRSALFCVFLRGGISLFSLFVIQS